eukprot:m.277762 g.277762  ORF g.277762 m.277762 type:complete len:114 (+) comp54879_c0_seq9:441-782(+)
MLNLGFIFVSLFSIPVLGVPVTRREVLASIIVAMGVLLGVSPKLFPSPNSDAFVSDVHEPWFNAWYFISAFAFGVVVQALQAVYQERAFRYVSDRNRGGAFACRVEFVSNCLS